MLALALAASTLTSCKKENDKNETKELMNSTFNYEFNNGQIVSSSPYKGKHSDNLTAKMELNEMSNGTTEIKVTLMNTVNGVLYHLHAHDAADPSLTPNGTPYNESPNSKVLTDHITGNGGNVSATFLSSMSFKDLTTTYDGFFVVHDPLQSISTTDISTYIVLGKFARQSEMSNLKSKSFSYNFNTGQVSSSYKYSGNHPMNLMATLNIQELSNGGSRVAIKLENSINGEMYHIHAHDAADANTTPNGTPYNESPNTNLLTQMVTGNGGTVMTSQNSSMSYSSIIDSYSGFLVVHDPLQSISTTDPTTYVILGSFAK
jgi:hypothetical protein